MEKRAPLGSVVLENCMEQSGMRFFDLTPSRMHTEAPISNEELNMDGQEW